MTVAIRIWVGLIAYLSLVPPAESSDKNKVYEELDRIGRTYDISERDILEVIEEELQNPEKAKYFEKTKKELDDKARGYARSPRGTSLPRAVQNRQLVYDPTITLLQDIRDANGKVIFPAGTKANPLNVMRYEYKLCFLDGNDEAQIKWAKNNCSTSEYKRILVAGSPLELSKRMKVRFYFDQDGILIKKFSINALPALVTAGDKVMNVEEIPIH